MYGDIRHNLIRAGIIALMVAFFVFIGIPMLSYADASSDPLDGVVAVIIVLSTEIWLLMSL